MISAFRTRGPSTGNDEFVELFNKSGSAVPVGGWTLRGSNTSGTNSVRATIAAGVTIPAGGYYLITNSAASGYSGSVPGNLTYTTGITDDGGLAVADGTATLVDQVGMSAGSAYKEGTTLTPMSGSANQEYRRTNRCSDTNNNSADFQLNGTPSLVFRTCAFYSEREDQGGSETTSMRRFQAFSRFKAANHRVGPPIMATLAAMCEIQA